MPARRKSEPQASVPSGTSGSSEANEVRTIREYGICHRSTPKGGNVEGQVAVDFEDPAGELFDG